MPVSLEAARTPGMATYYKVDPRTVVCWLVVVVRQTSDEAPEVLDMGMGARRFEEAREAIGRKNLEVAVPLLHKHVVDQ